MQNPLKLIQLRLRIMLEQKHRRRKRPKRPLPRWLKMHRRITKLTKKREKRRKKMMMLMNKQTSQKMHPLKPPRKILLRSLSRSLPSRQMTLLKARMLTNEQ